VVDFGRIVPCSSRAGELHRWNLASLKPSGLSAPWRVVEADFRPSEGIIVFQIDNAPQRLTRPALGATTGFVAASPAMCGRRI